MIIFKAVQASPECSQELWRHPLKIIVPGPLLVAFLVPWLGGLGACASISSGTTQSINVNSTPDEADCVLSREGKEIATVRTPGPVRISRASKPIRVVCNKTGYNAGESALDAQFEAATMGNLILGGVVGLAVDAASGASQRYPSFVSVTLTPAAGTAPAAAATPEPSPASAAPAAVARGAASPAPETGLSPIAPATGLSRSRL